DDEDVANLYTMRLEQNYEVRTAYDGNQAFDLLDDDVDVVLLDRRMPEMSGNAVLNKIRGQGYQCKVAMVTAVEPHFDVIEMGFDDYLSKPVSRDELNETVERLISRATYDKNMQEYFALISKKAVLEHQMSEPELERNDKYENLEKQIEETEEKLVDDLKKMDGEHLGNVLRELAQELVESKKNKKRR
ncbi:MAG: response regulator, partial [Halobacteria archaeon]|nr:response regulator [Halobacteria archaeon]